MPKVLRPHLGPDGQVVLDGGEAVGSAERIAYLQKVRLVETAEQAATDKPARKSRQPKAPA
jgi:hypothetical protein